MSSIGPDFGVTKETRGQQTPMTPRTNTTLQTLGPATGEEVLPAHDAVRGQVLTPPRLEQSWVSIYIKREAWALNPYADMARVTAILDYLQRKFPEHLDPSHPLLLAYEELKATLAASPVPAVKDRAKLL
jgi:hypothetical protein